MTRQEGIRLFHSMHPDFFTDKHIRNMPKDWIFAEMVLSLDKFRPDSYDRKLDAGISFGYYQGNPDILKKTVGRVDPDWVQYYGESPRVYCGYIDGKIASFCQIADMGTHPVNGRLARIGGPGCVGTLPEYRDRGIGLTMVGHVTRILKEEGYAYSYIHYTSVAPWYEKLGYQITIQWTGNGIL